MSFNSQLNEQEKKLQDMYEDAKQRLAAYRLQATLYDTAQALIDRGRPGETVAEIIINTNSATPVKELLEKADTVIENAKKQPATKKVFVVMAHDVQRGDFWPTCNLENSRFDSLKDAFAGLEKAEKNNAMPISLKYFVLGEEVEA